MSLCTLFYIIVYFLQFISKLKKTLPKLYEQCYPMMFIIDLLLMNLSLTRAVLIFILSNVGFIILVAIIFPPIFYS